MTKTIADINKFREKQQERREAEQKEFEEVLKIEAALNEYYQNHVKNGNKPSVEELNKYLNSKGFKGTIQDVKFSDDDN